MNKPRDPIRLDIQVEVDALALQKLWLYVDLAQAEVSVLGLAEEVVDPASKQISTLRVTDFFLVKQKSSVAETEMEPDGIVELLASGIDSSKLRCWAHSHGSMPVFWSTQDATCIEGLANDGWLLSLVVNKKRETMMRLDVFHPTHLFLEDIIWQVHYALPEEIAAACLNPAQLAAPLSLCRRPIATRSRAQFFRQ